MGRLSDLVCRAIESRRDMMNRVTESGLGAYGFGGVGASVFGRSVHALPPLLSCDFRLDFEVPWGPARSTDFMLTDLNLGDSGLSWAPHSSMETVPMPTVTQSYFTIQFYVSGDAKISPSSFPTLYLYEKQFTPDGLLRLPAKSRRSAMLSREVESQKAYDMAAYFGAGGLSLGEQHLYEDGLYEAESFTASFYNRRVLAEGDRPTLSGWTRPTVSLYAVYPAGVTSDDEQEILLCSFEKCVFGTPRPQFAVGQTAGMTWSQQVGFRRVSWGEGGGGQDTGTFSQRSSSLKRGTVSGVDMVKVSGADEASR